MYHLQLRSLLTIVIIYLITINVNCKKVTFEDCGKGQVKSLDITPCENEPCPFVPGEQKNVTVQFEAIGDEIVESSDNKMIVDFVSIDIEYPGVDDDICEKLICPLIPGKLYNYTFQVEVKEYLPSLATQVTWQSGSHPHVFCASTNVIFEGSNTNESPNPDI